MEKGTNKKSKPVLPKTFDMREKDFSVVTHQFYTNEVDVIETDGKDNDLVIHLANGDRYIFRCSCAVLFMTNGHRIRVQ